MPGLTVSSLLTDRHLYTYIEQAVIIDYYSYYFQSTSNNPKYRPYILNLKPASIVIESGYIFHSFV